MKNKIVGMSHWGPVYSRKIHVYCKGSPKTAPHLNWFYAWSTNAHKTCRDAVSDAQKIHPGEVFKASFAKD